MQADTVTMMSALAACRRPAAMVATATTRCVPAKRTRDSTSTFATGCEK